MCCTRVELTGCGSVATAPASASSIAAIRSGENEAFEKSFIRCVRFAGRGVRVLIQPAGRPHVPNLRRIAEQIMRGEHYTGSLGDAPDAHRQASPSATRSIWLTPLRSAPGPGGWAWPMIFSASQGKSAIQSPPSARRSTSGKHPRLGRPRRFKFTLPLFSSRGCSRGDRGSTDGIGQLERDEIRLGP